MPTSPESAPERLSTGVSGLDDILLGGFLRGGTYVIGGRSGTGKTILANQIAFHHMRGGGHVVYTSLLSETHTRLFIHLSSLSFFDRHLLGSQINYFSAYSILQQEGLAGVANVIRDSIKHNNLSLLILDGLSTAMEYDQTDLEIKEFVRNVQHYAEILSCTVIFLTHISPDMPLAPEYIMSDGVIELSATQVGPRQERELVVRKLRGSDYLSGTHSFAITDAGLQIYPRAEVRYKDAVGANSLSQTRRSFGVQRLDEMLHGGLLSETSTILMGTPGSGKTFLGLHFLHQGAEIGENGLYFGFYESQQRLIQKAERVGLDFGQHVESGRIHMRWNSGLEQSIDYLAQQLIELVRANNIQRLFIDGINGFMRSANEMQRIGPFFTAITNALRELGVTVLIALEMQRLAGHEVEVPINGISSISDNLIMLRYVELNSQLHRLISIIKLRDSSYDSAIREFKITDTGITVAGTFASAEAVLTGIGRPRSDRA